VLLRSAQVRSLRRVCNRGHTTALPDPLDGTEVGGAGPTVVSSAGEYDSRKSVLATS